MKAYISNVIEALIDAKWSFEFRCDNPSCKENKILTISHVRKDKVKFRATKMITSSNYEWNKENN